MRRWWVPALLLVLGAATPALAHPHVFIANRTTVSFQDGKLQGFGFQWTFDPMFSAMILGDYDPGHTGRFDAARTAALKAGAFDNLVNYHYFVAIWVGGKPFKLVIRKFTPSVADGGRLVYSFFIPVNVPVTTEPQTVMLTVYDDTYYVAFDILHLQDVAVVSRTGRCLLPGDPEDQGEAAVAGPVHAGPARDPVQGVPFMKRLAAAATLLLMASTLFAQEVPNPFTAKGSRPNEGFFHAVTSGIMAALANAMAPVQRNLNNSLAGLTQSLKGSRSLGGLLFVVLISLAYGMFHAAGPGHGKTIVSSYFLANEARLRHSVVIGYLIAAVHSLAALSVVLVLYYLIRGLFSANIEQANHWIQLGTFAVIAVIGGVMLVGRIRGGGHHHLLGHHGHDHHEHGEHELEDQPAAGITLRKLVGIAVPAGVIPCPGAVAIVLFALSLHMLAVSVLSVVSISVGMGITISATGAIVILAKQGALKAISAGHEERDSRLRRVAEVGGAALLFLFGLVFFLAQL